MTPTLLHELRRVIPARPLRYGEALRIAELQAAKLLALSGVTDGPVPETIISGLPKTQVERLRPLGVSGFSQWSKGRWLIVLNGDEPHGRQRFSLAHEFKHVIDHPLIAVLYPPALGQDAKTRAEQVCDHFAACLLMPRPFVKRAWVSGNQDVRRLAAYFEVSVPAMRMRLQLIGLTEQTHSRHGVAA
jgi:Zn-dependent peptidase ImmA (M78 family)